MPGTVRKTPEIKDPNPNDNVTPENENDTTTKDSSPEVEESKEPETNPVVIPEDWEVVPESEGGGIRPKTVPWAGYEGA